MFASKTATAVGVAGSTLVLAACGGGGGDRAGGSAIGEPVVLTMAQGNHEPPAQLISWAEEVAAQSDGSLQIEFANAWRAGETDAEIGTIGDVREGQVDLAWIGARAFDRAGVLSFQPLLAPLLVDSHDLQAAVFEAGIPDEMLDDVDDLDLAGIGVLPGPMRKVLGVDHPFLAPADFAGQVVGTGTSDLAARTMEVLGATPQDLPTGASLDGLDGMDNQSASIAGNNYALKGAGYVTANVNLWPRPLVIVMNGERFDSLTDDHQAVLRETIAAATDDALADSSAEDTDAVPVLCRQGLTIAVATADDLAALRAAVEPVYHEIAADKARREWLDRITSIKEELAVGPDTAECPADTMETADVAAGTELPTGTFEATITAEDYQAAGVDGGDMGTFTIAIDDETLTILQPTTGDVGYSGSYTVFRDQIEVSDGADTVTANWSFDGEQLTFSDVTPQDSPFEVIWASHPWQLVGAADSTDEGDGAGTLVGIYTWTLTADDAVSSGEDPAEMTWLPCTYVMSMDGGEWRLEEECSDSANVYGGTYEVFRDQVLFTWYDGLELAFTYAVDGSNLVLTPEPGTPDTDAFVWSAKTWERVDD
jgi:TRAP-type C4-dicarboxylate transport system substrate-binding protein